jgi:chromosome partitioning protein
MQRCAVAAFLNHKGGVGKTTSVANVGAGLAILGKRVLVVDLDPQGHLTSFLGVGRDEIGKTVYDVLRGDVHPRDAIITRTLKARFHIDGRETQLSMAVIPATLDFASAEEGLANVKNRAFLLRNAIAKVADNYDHILLDCSPSLGLISINALVAARRVFIPVQTEYLALHSLEDLMTRIESVMDHLNPDLEIGGLIATRFDARKVLSRTVVETLRERFGSLFLNTMIRDNIVLAESPQFGKDIFSYRPRSFGAEDYLNLSMEIMNRITRANLFPAVEPGTAPNPESSPIAV